ncbi:MAG: cation:proton antiporter [Dehalococcoidia bacterium]
MFPFQFVLQAPAIGPGTRSIPAGDILVWVLVNIALILLAARLVGGLFARFNQPRVVGEIVAGILLGPSLLGLSLAGELWGQQPLLVIQRLGDIALLFFMFLVGMELDFKLLRGREKQIALVALAVVLGPVALGFAIAPTPFLNTRGLPPRGRLDGRVRHVRRRRPVGNGLPRHGAHAA